MPLPNTIGINNQVRLATGEKARVVLLNNAATTPPFQKTLAEVNDFLNTYGALHRGAGPHASITYTKVQAAIKIIGSFINAPDDYSLIFTQNTSAAINLFARMLKTKKSDVIITSAIEHTSNNLPWRYNTKAKIIEVGTFNDGSIDYDDLQLKADKHRGKLKLITMTGASNLTGYMPNIKKLANLAHQHNALLFIDAAQLAPHRQIDMRRDGLNALAFSAHKLYAPFGLGVLAMPKKMLDAFPVNPGGGSIDMISEKTILWAPPEERHQTGTWNVTGIIALAASLKEIMKSSWPAIVDHERELIEYALKKLNRVPGLTLYVPPEKYLTENRIGTFTFNLKGMHHALVASVLEHEYGIETRAGTICNHKLVRRWHNVSDEEQEKIEQKISKGDRLASYGIVRVSLGMQNTKEDIDLLTEALTNISRNGPKLEYNAVPREEMFMPLDKGKYIP